MCIYVCMCMCMYVCMCIYVCVCMYIFMNIREIDIFWVTLYLSDYSSSIHIYNYFSSPYPMINGVLHESVLGHLLSLFIYIHYLP